MKTSFKFDWFLLLPLAVLTSGVYAPTVARAAFFSQTIGNATGMGSTANGLQIQFGAEPGHPLTVGQTPSEVVAKDSMGDKISLAKLGGATATFNYAGSSGFPAGASHFEVAGIAAAPFAAAQEATIFWAAATQSNIKSGATSFWQDKVNNSLGNISVEGRSGAFNPPGGNLNTVSIMLENDEAVAAVFTDIMLFPNQSIANFTIDNFSSVTGSPVAYGSDVDVPADSTLDITFNVTVDPTAYQYLSASVYDQGDSLSDAMQISTADVVPEPSSLALLGMGAFGLGMWRRRRVQ